MREILIFAIIKVDYTREARNTFMPTFAEKLHEVRKARDFTQDQLAKEMNVSRQTISHWENGRAVPDIDTIKHLSQVLDYNFLVVEETQPAPEAVEIPEPPEEESAQEKPVQQMESPPRKRRFISGRAPVNASPYANKFPSLLINTGIPNISSRNGPNATPPRKEGKLGKSPMIPA